MIFSRRNDDSGMELVKFIISLFYKVLWEEVQKNKIRLVINTNIKEDTNGNIKSRIDSLKEI